MKFREKAVAAHTMLQNARPVAISRRRETRSTVNPVKGDVRAYSSMNADDRVPSSGSLILNSPLSSSKTALSAWRSA